MNNVEVITEREMWRRLREHSPSIPIAEPRVMMATKAFHLLGDISRDAPDYFMVTAENDACFIGYWLIGFGFMEVCFPKDTTREMNDAERNILAKKKLGIV